MNTDVRGVHCDIDNSTREYLESKMHRLDFARELILDLPITITKGKENRFEIEVMIHFKWGNTTHVGVKCFDLFKGIDEIFDKMEIKINREKSKIQYHKGQISFRTGGIDNGDAEPVSELEPESES